MHESNLGPPPPSIWQDILKVFTTIFWRPSRPTCLSMYVIVASRYKGIHKATTNILNHIVDTFIMYHLSWIRQLIGRVPTEWRWMHKSDKFWVLLYLKSGSELTGCRLSSCICLVVEWQLLPIDDSFAIRHLWVIEGTDGTGAHHIPFIKHKRWFITISISAPNISSETSGQ